ncbi:MAG: chromate transporter [Clostridia bacterium]|nr:chromate transporter [Clostridia bacterium]
MKKHPVLTLFLTMLKIGAFTFGGGFAMLALLDRELVDKHGFLTHDEFMDLVVIAESTPGPVAINAATYVGYRVGGVIGALFSTLGVVLPSFSIIFLISLFFDTFLSLTLVAAAFRGIRAAVVLLILGAGVKMFRKMKKNAFSLSVMGVTLAVMLTFGLFAVSFSSIFYILISAVLGISVYLIGSLKKKEGDSK